MNALPKPTPDPMSVLATAVGRAAEALGLSSTDLRQILGVSESTLHRIRQGDRGIDPASKEGELALLLVRLFRSLDPLVGGDSQHRRAWMTSHHKVLGAKPAQRILSVEGLVATVAYLDGMRATA